MKIYNVIYVKPNGVKVVGRLKSFATLNKARSAIKREIMRSDLAQPEIVQVEKSAYDMLSNGLYFSTQIDEVMANTTDIDCEDFLLFAIESINLDEIFNLVLDWLKGAKWMFLSTRN